MKKEFSGRMKTRFSLHSEEGKGELIFRLSVPQEGKKEKVRLDIFYLSEKKGEYLNKNQKRGKKRQAIPSIPSPFREKKKRKEEKGVLSSFRV